MISIPCPSIRLVLISILTGSALLLPLLVPTLARAQHSETVAVFELEGEGVDQSLLGTLTSILRQEARQHPYYDLVEPPALHRSEVALVLGCNSDDLECLREVALYVDAVVIIFGDLTLQNSEYLLRIDIVHATRDDEIIRVERTFSDSRDPVASFRRVVSSIFQDSDAVHDTLLRIVAPDETMPIRIDGTLVGRGQLERTDLPPGRYHISVGAGNAPILDEIIILEAGSPFERYPVAPPLPEPSPNLPITSAVSPEQAPPSTTQRESTRSEIPPRSPAQISLESPHRSNLGAYSLLGVSALSLAGAGAMIYLMRDVESQIASENEAQTMTGLRYEELTQRGESFEIGQYVLLGASGLFFTAGISWLVGNAISNRRQPHALVLPSLSVSNQVTTLSITLDF